MNVIGINSVSGITCMKTADEYQEHEDDIHQAAVCEQIDEEDVVQHKDSDNLDEEIATPFRGPTP